MFSPSSLLQDLLYLCYPLLCPACTRRSPPAGMWLCLSCQLELPATDQHMVPENAFTERFWGRLPIETGAAMYHFVKGGGTQRLIHQLKYRGRKDVGRKLGEAYGRRLLESPFFAVDAIVPVPLHPRKERYRGFNQSAAFADGLSNVMEVPCYARALRRKTYTATQTRKSRLNRLKNVMDAFETARPGQLEGRHILLVDDVLTTGATLEACGRQVLAVEGTRLSLATIAIAE